MKKLNLSVAIFATAAYLLCFLSACNKDDDTPGKDIFYGPEVAIGNGKARSFVKLDANKNPATIGFTMTKGALENLPHESESYVLALPAEKAQTPYDHISLDWASHGHIPDGVYNRPHFDMHFYMISQSERAGIEVGTPQMENLPDATFIPPNYISVPGEGEPQMGKHWGDITSPEFGGKPFTTTFVYGSYDGKVIFHEPMMTQEWLLTKPDTVMSISQPEKFATSAHYPSTYSVKYDAAKSLYTISLDNLQLRQN